MIGVVRGGRGECGGGMGEKVRGSGAKLIVWLAVLLFILLLLLLLLVLLIIIRRPFLPPPPPPLLHHSHLHICMSATPCSLLYKGSINHLLTTTTGAVTGDSAACLVRIESISI